MSIVPRIDTPCPLAADEQRSIDGHCGRCDREVHRLDVLDVDARRALFAAANGPLCVSYRAPRRVGRIGAAIAATLITATAYAADPSTPSDARTERASPATGSRIARAEPRDLDEVLVVGAVNDPQDARLPEDTGVPVLPVQVAPVLEDDALIMGGVSDPAAVEWVDAETAAPELPMVTDIAARDGR